MRIQNFREFNGKTFELRVQPSDKLHRDHINPVTIRYKHVAERIAKYRREHGEEVRILKVATGYRIYWRKK